MSGGASRQDDPERGLDFAELLGGLHEMDRRKLLKRAAALGVTATGLPAFLAACGGSSSASSSSASSQGVITGPVGLSAIGPPRSGGTLRFSWQYPPVVQMDPQLPTTGDTGDLDTLLLIYDQLMNLTPHSFEPSFGLATSYEPSKNGLQYVFTIRDDALFSNGQPVTIEDVKFSIDRFANPKVNSQYNALLSAIQSTKIVGKYQLQITLEYPQGMFVDTMTHATSSIVPKNLVESMGKAFGQHPIGSGPFAFGSKNPGTSISLVRNEHYRKPGQPYLDGVTFTYFPDDNARALSVVSGEADAAMPIAYGLIDQYRNRPGYRLQIEPTSILGFINPNDQREPYTNKYVRIALTYATPVDVINRVVLKNTAQPANNTWGKLAYWDSSVPPVPYDLTKARAALAKSQVPHGFSTTMMIVAGDSDSRAIAEIVQSSWAQIGIKVTLQALDITTWTNNTLKGDFDIYLDPIDNYVSDVGADDEDAIYINDPLPLKFGQMYYSDPHVSALIHEVTHTYDTALRRKLFGQLAYYVLYVDPPLIPLVFGAERTLVTDKLQGLVLLVNESWRLENAWLNA